MTYPKATRANTTSTANEGWFLNRLLVWETIWGPKKAVKMDKTPKRIKRPTMTASMKFGKRISKTPAEKTNSLKGVGGGKVAGNISARNSWRSKRSRMRWSLASS